MTYAARTEVTVAKSQGELRALLSKHGITHFGIVEQPSMVAIAFQHGGHNHRIGLPLRGASDRAFTQYRNAKDREAAAAQEQKARWRALVLVVKAKLEYAAILGQAADTAFTEYRVLTDGRTVQEHVTGSDVPPALSWGDA